LKSKAIAKGSIKNANVRPKPAKPVGKIKSAKSNDSIFRKVSKDLSGIFNPGSIKKKLTPDNLRKLLLPNIPYGVFFIVAWQISGRIPVIPFPDWLVGLAVAVVMKLVVYMRAKDAKKYRKDVEYGSARWGTPADIAPFIDPKPENNIILTKTESLTMNSRPSKPEYARNKNVLVIGGSGSGKTRFFVKPNLMQCESTDYPVSFVITDPKGTILQEMGTFLKSRNYRIKVLNTIDFGKSLKYNPFPLLYKGGKTNTPNIQDSSAICGTFGRVV
jgi:type IV secretory pathway TraG/TraD family ATPase VirD4